MTAKIIDMGPDLIRLQMQALGEQPAPAGPAQPEPEAKPLHLFQPRLSPEPAPSTTGPVPDVALASRAYMAGFKAGQAQAGPVRIGRLYDPEEDL